MTTISVERAFSCEDFSFHKFNFAQGYIISPLVFNSDSDRESIYCLVKARLSHVITQCFD
jgi:hypothetical protein